MRSFATQPENEPLPFNRPAPVQDLRAAQASEAESLQTLVKIVQDDRQNLEKTYPVLPESGTLDGQILVNITVPFKFNSIVLCVVGGIVAVTHGDVPPIPALAGPGGEPVADSSSPFSWLFGANGITPGSSAGANPQPIALFTGPQEIRFKEREAGQKLTFWIHPDSHLALRNAIDPTYGTCRIVGAVEFLK